MATFRHHYQKGDLIFAVVRVGRGPCRLADASLLLAPTSPMYNNARKQSSIFVQQVAEALKEGKLDEAIAIAERNKKSHIAKVVATGLSEFRSASDQVSDKEVIAAGKRGLENRVPS